MLTGCETEIWDMNSTVMTMYEKSGKRSSGLSCGFSQFLSHVRESPFQQFCTHDVPNLPSSRGQGSLRKDLMKKSLLEKNDKVCLLFLKSPTCFISKPPYIVWNVRLHWLLTFRHQHSKWRHIGWEDGVRCTAIVNNRLWKFSLCSPQQ